MSLRGQSSIRGRVYYYVYLQNLPAKYMHSEIFPEILLHQQVREDIQQTEIHRQQAYCLFGFTNKAISCKFEKEMQKYMPPFVVISRRKIEISQELKQEKQYYDNKTLTTNVIDQQPNIDNIKKPQPQNQQIPFEIRSQHQQQQHPFSILSFFNKDKIINSILGRGFFEPFRKS